MSDIVQMTQTVDDYQSGSIYRVRTRNKEDLVKASAATVLDNQPEPLTTIEGE